MDGQPMDGQPVDAEPIVDCINVTALPGTGIASGDTSQQMMVYEGGCFAAGGRETVYAMTLPGRAQSISIYANAPSQSWFPALHLYRETCDPMDRVGCTGSDPLGDTAAQLLARNLPAGDYAIVIDGIDAANFGSFTLDVDVVIGAGERCQPNVAYQRCQVGSCEMDGTEYRCPPLFDCLDGVDVDDDGMLDEDTCTNPPAVTCPTTTVASPTSIEVLTAVATDDVGVTNREWIVTERPLGSKARANPPNADSTVVTFDLAGDYRARYIAYDADNQTGACDLTVSATTTADLYVEAYWLDDPFDAFDVDLHLLHPLAMHWYDTDYACMFENDCAVTWGAIPENNPAWSGDAPGTGFAVEATRVPRAETGAYGIGIATVVMPSEVYINVYCRGTRVQTFRSTLLSENLFWKVANVRVDANGCDVEMLNALVTTSAAQMPPR
jgi:hypothetical protein